MRRHSSSGFTLIEVMVALTIGAMVVAMVHEAFGAAADLSARLDAQRASHAQAMRARAVLQQAFGSLAIGVAGSSGFEGLPNRVTFSTTLPSLAPERAGEGSHAQPVTLATVAGWLVLRGGGPAPDSLLRAERVTFEYLLEYGAQARWVQEWHSPASAPLAVRLRLQADSGAVDTLMLVIGPRG